MTLYLNLRGNELPIYAIIYSFSKDGQGCFFGTRQYLALICNCSIRSVDNALKNLVKRKLVLKEIRYDDNHQKRCEYIVNLEKIEGLGLKSTQRINCSTPAAENAIPVVQNLQGRAENFARNNKEYNNKEIIKNTLSEADEKVKQYGRFENVRLTAYLYDYLTLESEEWIDEYINDSGNLKITNLDRLIFTKNGEFTI
ncbi:helix-turn-helix domain-containing protein [uncultured Holdemanella sp.]|uniref:helix-turn-helix domain-containing protein n=1 Tax=uncultured Holdemanella sp. TaxID=1763549 RepID=UPI0025FC0144|nr:helix-turn-helix domain-containing protein [uncultured Holdemanella sp.]